MKLEHALDFTSGVESLRGTAEQVQGLRLEDLVEADRHRDLMLLAGLEKGGLVHSAAGEVEARFRPSSQRRQDDLVRQDPGAGARVLRARREPELIGQAVEQVVKASAREGIQDDPVHDQVAGPKDVARVEALLVAPVDDRNRVADVSDPRHQLGAEHETDCRRGRAALEPVAEAQRELAELVALFVSPHERADDEAVVREREG